MTITRRHHPLEGKTFAVIMAGRQQIVVRLDDGSTIRIPRPWTDADGPRSDAPEHVFTVDAVRELLELIAALGHRSSEERVSRCEQAVVAEHEARST